MIVPHETRMPFPSLLTIGGHGGLDIILYREHDRGKYSSKRVTPIMPTYAFNPLNTGPGERPLFVKASIQQEH